LPVLLESWPAIHAAIPDSTLHILGADREESPHGVECFGWVGDETKRSELAAAAVFCAPNLGGESFGIIVAEAMASACAVVASSIAAFEHVAGPTARFVPAGDSRELGRQVIDLLSRPGEAATLGAAAAQRVQRFDGRAVAQAYLGAYADAIGAG